MKVLKGFLIAIVAIVLIIVIAGVIILNMTPKQLKLDKLDLGGITIDELGLADTKLITIYKSFKSLGKVNEKDIVKNEYNPQQEQTKANETFEGSSLEDSDDYSSIIDTPVVYDKQYLIEYNDTTLAYILNNVVEKGSSTDEAVKYLHDANVKIKELSVMTEDGKGKIRIVASLDLGSYKAEIEEQLGAAKSVIGIPDTVYIVSELGFSVNGTGKMETTPDDLTINGRKNDPVGEAVMKVALSKTGEVETTEDLNAKLGDALSSVVGNLGSIGTAETDSAGVITGDIIYGMSAVSDHKIKLVTHCKEN